MRLGKALGCFDEVRSFAADADLAVRGSHITGIGELRNRIVAGCNA